MTLLKGLTNQRSAISIERIVKTNIQMTLLKGLTNQRSEIEQSGPYHAVEAGVAVAGTWPASDLSVQEAILLQIEGSDHEQSED